MAKTSTHLPLSPVWTLNPLQVLMRRWSKSAPYVASQFLRLRGIPDRTRWEAAIGEVIAESGIGNPTFTRGDRAVQFSPSQRVVFETVSRPLMEYVEQTLNLPFQDHELPIRFFIHQANGDFYEMGLTYDHWLADSRAIRDLLLRITDRYRPTGATSATGIEGPAQPPPRAWDVPGFHELFQSHLGSWRLGSALRAGMDNVIKHASAYRIPLHDPLDFTTSFLRTPLPAGLITRVRQRARQIGVSVNDLFLAVLGRIMSEFTRQGRQQSRRRNRLGLGVVVDLRDAANISLDHVFGSYMSLCTVVLAPQDDSNALSLANDIARQTRLLKQPRARVQSMSGLEMALFASDYLCLNKRHRSSFFQRYTPVVAAISNVNVESGWTDADVLEYSRITPLGPATPLAFTTTTLGDRANLSVTYRTTAFQKSQAETLMQTFVGDLILVTDGATDCEEPHASFET